MTNQPLYKVIMKDLESKITSGSYSMGDMLASETELEKLYGVSNITARRALNELVNRGLVYRVKGGGTYVKAIKANDPAVQQQKIISLLMPFDSSEGGASDLICGMSDYLYSRQYILSVTNCHNDIAEERQALEALVKTSMGIVFYPRNDNNNVEYLYMLYAKHYPFVTVDKTIAGISIPSVTTDNVGGAYSLTKYLLEKGHRRISFISDAPIQQASSIRDRFIGYCTALSDGGIEFDARLHITGLSRYVDRTQAENPGLERYSKQFGEEIFKQVLLDLTECDNPVTGIFALNDIMACDIISAAGILGLRVPEDISVVGFDNIPLSGKLPTPLTTVQQDFYTMGNKAGEMIVALCEGKALAQVQSVLPTQLIERASVRPYGNE